MAEALSAERVELPLLRPVALRAGSRALWLDRSEEAPESRTVIKFLRGVPVETPSGIDPGFAFNVGVVGLELPAA